MRLLSLLRRLATEPVLRRRALVVALTAALSPLPLVGTLGYESSLLLTAPLSLLGIGVGVDAIRAIRAAPPPADAPGSSSLLAVAGPAMLRELLVLLGLALGVLLVAQLWNPTCDLVDGLAFFGLGPAISALLGGISGLWGATLVRKDARRRQLLVAALPMLGCAAVLVGRLYADPVVFVHDPFWGHFSGPLYDEAVAITPRALWFRAYNVVAAVAALLALELLATPAATLLPGGPRAWGQRLRARPLLSLGLGVALTTSAWFGLWPERHHFNATVDSLSRELSGQLRTEHFVIHYAPGSTTARELELVAAEHEFAWHRLAQRIGREPEVPVHSFVFPDPDTKRTLMGAGHTEVAPPWRGHLYLNDQPFPHRVLHHELAHAFSAPLGDPLFGLPSSVGLGGIEIDLALVEGFAEALAPRPREGLDLHDQAAVLDRLGLRPELEPLMGLGFWGKSSRHAYAAAGSFSLWLAQTRGVEPLVALYGSGGDFQHAYGASLAELEAQWVAFLHEWPVRPRDIEVLRERYRKRAIFERPCAHRSANLLAEARRARERGDLETTVARLERVCALEPEQNLHRIALARAQAQAGAVESARALLEQVAAEPELTHTLVTAIDELLGDLALQRGDLAAARERYDAALLLHTSESMARRLEVKALATEDPQLVPLVLDALAPFEPRPGEPGVVVRRLYAAVRIQQLPPHAPLGAYLVGLRLLEAQDPARAAEAFERALAPRDGEEPLPSVELVRDAREGLLEASVRVRDYDRGSEVLAALLEDPELGNGHRHTYALWGERIAFFRTHRPAAGDR